MHEMTQPHVVCGDDDVLLTEPAYPFQRHMGFVMKAWSADRAVFELPLQDYLTDVFDKDCSALMSWKSDLWAFCSGGWQRQRRAQQGQGWPAGHRAVRAAWP